MKLIMILYLLCRFEFGNLFHYCSSYTTLVGPYRSVMNSRLLEYCTENNACIGVKGKNEVGNIAETLKKLNLYSVATSGK